MADDLKFVIGVDDRDLIRSQKEQLKFQRNLITIENAFRSNQITASRYNKELAAQAKQLQSLGGTYRKASSEVRTYAYALRQADDAALKQAQSFATAGKSVNRFGMYAQQVGYQVGDFFVQVQSGTNAFVAFGQQATQLAGLLPGLAGAIAGIGISVGTMLLSMWSRSKEAEGGIKSLTSALKTAREDSSKFADEIERLNRGLKDTAELTYERAIAQEKENLRLLKDQLGTGDALSGSVEEALLKAQEDKVAAAEKELELYKERREQVGQLKSAEEQRADAQEAYLQAQINLQNEVDAALWDIYTAGLKINEVWVKLEEDIGKSAVNALKLANVDISKGLSQAAIEAAKIAANLGISFNAAINLMNLQSSLQYSGRGGDPRSFNRNYMQDPNYKSVEQQIKEWNEKNKSKGSKAKSPAEQLEEYLRKAEQEVALKIKQVGLTEAQARAIELETKFLEAKVPVDQARIEALVKEEEALRKATETEQQKATLMASIGSHIENAFMAMVDGSKSVEDAMKTMIRNIILDIYRQMVVKQFLSFFGFANGGVFKNGNVTAFANGGVVGSPTYFPMAGGKTGLMGEAGPEAIMPLKRGPNGKLGVVAEGGSGAVNIVQHFNFSANGDESVKRIIKQQLPDITNATKAAVADSKRRGGAYGRAFN